MGICVVLWLHDRSKLWKKMLCVMEQDCYLLASVGLKHEALGFIPSIPF